MKTVKFGSKSMMLWAYIKSDGSIKLVNIDGNFNRVKYIQLLKDNLKPDLDGSKIFQQERALWHRLRATKQSLVDENVTILKNWSTQSSDLNTIK